ncbi:MAG: 6-phosphogluconolactonase [Planctomycetota bacterium]|nr:6-phosphogluconolactonase [Planctomycetota bacterium]
MKPLFPTIICTDPKALAEAVADKFLYLAFNAVPGPLTVALSGGSTPKRLYELLAQPPYFEKIPWERVEFFFGDERSVPPEHVDSNYRMAREALLDKVPSKVHRMAAESGRADEYEAVVRARVPGGSAGIPRFDLVLLGIGTDGHTASLFPGTDALQETKKLVVMNDVPKLKTARMTFTYPLLNAAKKVWVLASGEDKQKVVQDALYNPDSAHPIVGVRPQPGEVLWWLDGDSGTLQA